MKDLPKLLVVDDDDQILKQVKWALSEDYQVFTAGERRAALDLLRREGMPVVLLDLGLPPFPRDATEGLQALEEILTAEPFTKVIIVSGNSDRTNALLAVERGAYDIFPKPVDVDELKVVLGRATRRAALERESSNYRRQEETAAVEGLIGSSPAIRSVFTTIRKVSGADVPVLLLGESGTGKELVAQAIHNASPRREKPFVAINCGAIPENLLESELFGYEKGAFTGASAQRRGKVEFAQGGTLFLDEIGDLANVLQVKLLRFLQEKSIERIGGRENIPVDCRVLAATNKDLEKAVAEGRFREDLYFRLAVVKCVLPPLRERGEDVIQIAEHLIRSYAEELGQGGKRLTREALEALRRHPWPGNVRELQNRVKRAMVLADGPWIGANELELSGPSAGRLPVGPSGSLRDAREELEREMVANALRESKGNVSRAARTLGISRPTLYELMQRYGL